MAVFNLGSINADHFYNVPHLPGPGETLAADGYGFGLGGKGANQSIAAAHGGAKVVHIGAVGQDGDWAIARLKRSGVSVDNIAKLDMPTAHAIINVDPNGENAIVIFSSANLAQTEGRITTALQGAKAGDICILQNETNLVKFTAQAAKDMGMTVVYSAAPFDVEKASQVLPFIDILAVNEIESKQLTDALNVDIESLPVAKVLVTRGSKGACLYSGQQQTEVAAYKVNPVDTTGAGDTYLGFFVAALDVGKSDSEAMKIAAAGSAIQVTRPGTSDAIPSLAEVTEFLKSNDSQP